MQEIKMTDAEIIKIMERCAKDEIACVECPFNYNGDDCNDGRIKMLYGVIVRKQAEIDKLLVQSGHFDTFARNLCGKRLRNGNKVTTFEDLQSYISKQKAEAVREFAEKLKGLIYPQLGVEVFCFCLNEIDNLVKEFGKDINVRANPEQVKGEENG